MNVLIIGEIFGRVREAMRRRGHNAWSNDILPTEDGSPYHLHGDGLLALAADNGRYFPQLHGNFDWDLLIGHPPCTYMANSGVKHLYKGGKKINGVEPQRWRDLDAAVKFMGALWSTRIGKVCLENPIMHRHARQRFGFDPTQIIQPWMFGHEEMKATCLWLRGLPRLQPTEVVGPPPKDPLERRKWARVHRESPGPDRWKRRSITYQGIADAMADQWGNL